MGNGFEQVKYQMKKILKKGAKVAARALAPVLAIVLIVVIVVCGLGYEMTRQDGSYKEGDMGNVMYAVTQYTQDVIIDQDGTIRTTMSAQELWDEMLKNNSRVDEYLDNPQELARLMNAEIVTNYPDTRPADEIDEPLDEEFWKNLNNDVDSTETQGIIKFKRAKEDGTISTMTYVSPEVFNSYIEAYNASGSDADKNTALSHFTIEKQYSTSSIMAGTIEAGTVIEIPEGFGNYYTYMGWQLITAPSSNQYRLREMAGQNFDEEGFGIINGRYVIACTTTFGQVGDYIDFYLENGIVLPCIIGDIKNQNDPGCNQWGHNDGQCVVEFVVDRDSWYGIKENPGNPSNHPEWNSRVVKAVNGGSYFENPNFGVDSEIEANDNNTTNNDNDDDDNNSSSSNSDTLKWPTDGTTITSYFGLRDAPTAGASTDHGAIDIGVPTGTNVYAAKDGTVTISCYDSSAGNMIEIDHGGGFVTRYYHNSELLVSVGDTVTQGQVIAKSGNTGTSTGPHVHFETRQNGVKVDPLSFKYENGMGSGTGTIGSGGDAKTKYVVKVATWNERFEESVAGGDGSVDPEPITDYIEANTTYTMTAQTVDYQSMVSGYQMPFDYLWAWIVAGRDKDFGLDIADLVFDSEIEITIHDNVKTVTDIDTYEYTRKTKVHTHDIHVTGSWSDTEVDPNTGESTSTSGNIDETNTEGSTEEILKNYTIVHTTKNTTDTLNVSVTKADVWIVEYTQDFEYQPNETTDPGAGDPSDLEQNREYPDSPDEPDVPNEDPCGIAADYEASVRSNYSDKDTVNTEVTCLTDYYYGLDGTVTNHNIIDSQKYTSSPKDIRPKDEPKSKTDEVNFVTLLQDREHYDTRNNILSAPEWLFEMLEENEKTVDMVDLTKYLIYCATGREFDGIDSFDFDKVFDPANFSSLNGSYGTSSGIDGVQGQIFDFFLAKGMPPAGVAAIMGNIEAESSFDPAATNGTHNGLCQWAISDRFQNLQNLANSKGTDWTDVETQCEFIWQELEGSYSDVKDVLMNSTSETDLEYATWYFGRYYEVFFSSSNNFNASKDITAARYDNAKKWYQAWEDNHTSGSAQLGEAASIEGEQARIDWLYDGNGVPTSEAENNQYLETFPVEYLDANGNRQTMNVTMHRKLKTEVQAIFKEMADAGFKIVGGDISYRQWGSDAGFRGTFPQSAHTYGHAFDVNPEQNYCIYADGTVVGSHYSPGSDPYSVTEEIINIWKRHGFYWGGDWTSLKDYMHFSYFNH